MNSKLLQYNVQEYNIERLLFYKEEVIFLGGKMSRDKGKRYERELANVFKRYGYDARRTSQYCGNTGDASDVVGLPGIHVEAKHQEQIKIYDWMNQALHDSSKSTNKPTVFFRKNNKETLVCMYLKDWIELYETWRVVYGDKTRYQARITDEKQTIKPFWFE